MNVIGHRKVFYVVSALAVAASVSAVAVWGLRLGIDFTGGSLIEVEFTRERLSVEELNHRLGSLNLGSAGSGIRLQPTGERGLLIRLRHLSEAEHQEVLRVFDAAGGVVEKRFDTIGPTIGRELARKSVIALILVILLIVSYIAWAFRKVSAPVASWKYGVAAIVALAHDVIIPSGFFAVAGRLSGFEADTLFVTAILTILGFSVHDTIVVFDRIRENLRVEGAGSDFGALVNRSIAQTITRSINTSLTVVLALAAVYFFGGASTKAFSATLIVGIIAGTYSSICIASPILVTWHQWQEREKVKG